MTDKIRWEYNVVVLDANAATSKARLDELGVNGWELVAISGRYESEQFAYLKRSISHGR